MLVGLLYGFNVKESTLESQGGCETVSNYVFTSNDCYFNTCLALIANEIISGRTLKLWHLDLSFKSFLFDHIKVYIFCSLNTLYLQIKYETCNICAMKYLLFQSSCQPSGTEYGYHVMRFMKEVIQNHILITSEKVICVLSWFSNLCFYICHHTTICL